MTDTADLERGYRRWLRCYPKSFRREHGADAAALLLGNGLGWRITSATFDRERLITSTK